MFLRFLYIFDLFKTPLTLLFEKKRFISTKFGVLCSLGIFCILLIMIVNSDLFRKEVPQIISNNLPLIHRPAITYNNKILAIGVQDDENFFGFYDPSYYQIYVTNVIYNMDASGVYSYEIIDKNLHLCSENDVIGTEFQGKNLNNNLCFDKNENNFTTEGFFDEKTVKFLSIDFILCDNSTSNITCKSFEEMKAKLNGMTLNIFFMDATIDSLDYQNPIKYSVVNKYLYIDLEFHKNFELYFQNINLKSDDGILFDEISEKNEISYISETTDFSSVSKEDLITPRLSFQIFSSKKVQNIERKYTKVSDLLAKLGGVMQGLVIMCYFFVYIEHSLFLKNTVLNSLYMFQINKKDKTPSNIGNNINRSSIMPKLLSSKETPKKIEMFSSNITLESNQVKRVSRLTTFFARMKKVLDLQNYKDNPPNSQKLNFGLIKYLILKWKELFFCLKLNFEEEMFKKSEKIYEKELDFIDIIKKLQEFEKLKKIILNPNQLTLFNFLAKPLLHLNSGINKNSTMNSINLNVMEKRRNEEIKNAFSHYENLKSSDKLSEIDQRILCLLNDDIKNYS